MFFMKQFLVLLSISLSETSILQQIVTKSIPNSYINSTFEQILDTNSSFIELSENNSTTILSKNETNEIIREEQVFDNEYSEQILKESDNITEEFYSGPHYEANWTFIDQESLRVTFSLFSLANITNEKRFSNKNDKKINLFPNLIFIPSRRIQSISSLKYYLFTIRHDKTNTEKVLKMEQLLLKSASSKQDEHFSNSLLLIRLNPNEKYSICIYYYQTSNSAQMPDLIICQEIMHDHLKHSVHGLLFILTQYSIILGILIVLQGLFSMRKRRIAHILHQHLLEKAQRLRRRLSSVSLIRHSFSSVDVTPEHHNALIHGLLDHKENKLTKRNISSPAIVLSDSPILLNNVVQSAGENEPFLKLSTTKNHVHFLLGMDPGSDDNSSGSNTTLSLETHREPYDDRSNAFLSMAHILDSNKPWSKQKHHIGPL